ncbi:c-di-GMP-binding flagellar brake protein YcgR [Anaerosolibacter carboniphilus]|uniref:C-di-GMP-binding flagellar brake protein YcgR n=1 Tax=Anaerosolibacter carboniphilus TaxID=1417629 RepID=A0A841KQN7_9FIRM|nr:PilZ domain-containing protein [Anaerosolibacter carboniphilus]MBB6215796.1 c-di-GMP-binding flagellar brake protein YcgR [Anaerosolibacter carboniphilus]
MTSPLTINQRIRMKLTNELGEVELAGTIENITENDIYVLLDYKFAHNKNKLEVACTIWDQSGKAYLFNSFIHTIKGQSLRLKRPQDSEMEQLKRRDQVRAGVDIPVSCYIRSYGDMEINSEKFVPAVVKDLSIGGLLLHSTLSLPVDTVIVLELPLEEELILVTVRILRNQTCEEGYAMGGQFVALDDRDVQKIRAFVFRTQIRFKRQKEPVTHNG